MVTSFVVCAAITAISAFVSLGFSLAAIPHTVGNTRSLAFYACARSAALAAVAVVPFVNASVGWLEAVATAMIVVQGCDAIIGAASRDRMKTLGPAGTAVANFAALVWLLSGA